MTPRGSHRLSGAPLSSMGKVAVGEEIAHPAADAGPVLVEGGHRQQVGDVDLLDEDPDPPQQLPDLGDAVGVEGVLAVRVDGDGHAAHQEGLGMGVLGAEDGVDQDDVLLPLQGLQVVGDGHQVGLGGELVGGVSPVGVLEGAEPAGADEGGDAVLDPLEVGGARLGPVGDGLGELGGFGRVGLEGAGDVHPVEGMQVVEVDDMVLQVLGGHDQVADQAGVVGDPDFERILHAADAGDGMDRGADPAETLGEVVGVPGIAALEDRFRSPGTWWRSSRRWRSCPLPAGPRCAGGPRCG